MYYDKEVVLFKKGGLGMSKKHLSLFVGLSVAVGLASSLLIKKKRQTHPSKDNLQKLYQGNWSFYDRHQRVKHTLNILTDLSVLLDNNLLVNELLELTADKMVVRDPYGYHLVFKPEEDVLDFYDEANDCHYQLTKNNDSPS